MKKIISILIFLSLLSGCGPTLHNDLTLETNDEKLSKNILEDSLALGTEFLLNNQKEEGNFTYEYDFITQTFSSEDNQVRQAGALWGIALLYQANPTNELEDALQKGLDFFTENSEVPSENPDGGLYIAYPSDKAGSSGTMALVSLALIDYLSTNPNAGAIYEQQLEDYLAFILSLRKDDGHFYGDYEFETGFGFGESSPYSDGEILLTLIKAAKTMNHEEYEDIIIESAAVMYEDYVEIALEKDPDSDTSKGFFQWGIMSFYELYTSKWKDKDYANWSIDLAYWMIDVHKTLSRTRNTAYAYEGIISAWEIARLTGDNEAQEYFGSVIDEGIYKLSTWQVGSEIQNSFLAENPTSDKYAVGGVTNQKAEPGLRIDVTQHQMHSILMALKWIYTD